GKKEVKDMLDPFVSVPLYEEDPSYYTDWGDSRAYGIGDIGMGECAGEVVSLFSMEIIKAESELFEGLIALDDSDYQAADEHSYQAMLLAARALIRVQYLDARNDVDTIVNEFRTRFYD